MKRNLFLTLSILLLLVVAYQSLSAYQALHVYAKGKDKPDLHIYAEIDSITTELNNSVPQQLFYTKDSLYIYNIPDIDSIAVNVPFIKYLDIDEIHLPNNHFEFTFEFNHSRHYYNYNWDFKSDSDWLHCGSATEWQEGRTYWTYGYADDLNEDRSAYLYLESENEIIDSIKVIQHVIPAYEIDLYNTSSSLSVFRLYPISLTWQKHTTQIKANEPFTFSGLMFLDIDNGTCYSECDWVKYSISEDKRMLILEVEENNSDTTRFVCICPCFYPNMMLNSNNFHLKQHQAGTATPEMQKEALIDLYNSMGGVNWGNNENWLSDKPLWQWGGLVLGLSEDVMTIDITNASGEFPASLASIMDVADEINITGSWDFWTQTHSLQGAKIPKEITHHPRWDKFGWRILFRNRDCGKGISMDGINLRIKDEPVLFPDSTTSTTYEVLSRNKYSLISVGMPSDEMANVFLSYRNKGFGYIHAAQDWHGGTIEELRETAKNYPLDIIYTYQSFSNRVLSPGDGTGFGQLGSTFLLDSIGNVVDFEAHDWSLPNSYYANRIDSILHNLLGEPEPHDPFVSTYYTSSDYSRDGEVLTLQEATVGNGIDLVFMGDAYDDRDMGEGGLYESNMRKSMEYFFGVEPYKSFRDRFNVYAVKVVSPNSHIGDGCTQAINYSDEVCFNYASKIEGIDLEQVSIVNVVNAPNSFYVSGHANMYESGASVAHIEQGGASSIIVHEAGGHGFAKLLDEYIYGGYEDNYCPPENLESFKQWIKTDYHNRGWGVNVDATNAPDSVVWSHFLQDSRYADEVGIYQGAWYWPTDLWRASENSVMNSDHSYFNAPSREAIYKRIMQLSEGDDWVYDYETFVEWDKAHQSSNNGGTDNPTTGANVWTCYYNDTNWGNSTVYAYVWDGGNENKEYLGSWAGTPMTKNADGLWEITFSTDDNLVTPMVIFSNGNSGNPNQTADLTLINNGVYNFNGYIKEIERTVEQNSVQMRPTVEPVVVRRSENHRMPTIIKGSPLNPQGVVPLPDFMNK